MRATTTLTTMGGPVTGTGIPNCVHDFLSSQRALVGSDRHWSEKARRVAALCSMLDHHTVARYVAVPAAGVTIEEMAAERATKNGGFAYMIAEWVKRSNAKVRADVVQERLVAMGYSGSERTTRRVAAIFKPPIAMPTTASIGPGSPNPACGRNTTSATGRSSRGSTPRCSAPGWRGVASVSSSRSEQRLAESCRRVGRFLPFD